MHILMDGWCLIYEPASPAALQLAALLDTCPPDVPLSLALPAATSEIDLEWIPKHVKRHSLPTPATPQGRLTWEQFRLPRMAQRSGASWIHSCHAGLPWLTQAATCASPAGWNLELMGQVTTSSSQAGLVERLRQATGWGGLNRASAVFWPHDLPQPHTTLALCPVPPLVHPLFHSRLDPTPDLFTPEPYFLYHGPLTPGDIARLLAAWSWAAAPLGGDYTLRIYGVPAAQQPALEKQIKQADLEDSTRLLAPVSPPELAALYLGCSALLQPAPISPWGDPVRHALACGKPVVATAGAWQEALVGPAAYLVQADDARRMGAALISVAVETDLADQLSTAALERAASWTAEAYWEAVFRLC